MAVLSDVPVLVPSAYGLIIALLAAVFIAVLRGLLVPRKVLEDAQAEAERWQRAYENERAARERLIEHSQAAIEAAKTTAAVLTALPMGDGGRDADAVAS